MGLFRKLADLAERSNDKWYCSQAEHDRQKEASEKAQHDFESNVRACANCTYYGHHPNYCIKHDFYFDSDSVKYDKVQYKNVCSDFFRK